MAQPRGKAHHLPNSVTGSFFSHSLLPAVDALLNMSLFLELSVGTKCAENRAETREKAQIKQNCIKEKNICFGVCGCKI